MSVAAKGETWQATTTQSAMSIVLAPIFRAGPKRLARLTSMCPERVNTDSNYYDTTSTFQTYPPKDSWNLDILQSKVNDMDGISRCSVSRLLVS